MKPAFLSGALVLLFGMAAEAAGGVYVGRTVLLNRPVEGRVVVLGGKLQIAAPVSGDVVSWGAPVQLSEGGSIRGRLVMFGGTFSGSASAVSGGLLSPGSLAAVYLAEARRSPLAPPPAGERATILAVRLCLLAIWLLVSTAVLRWWPSSLVRASIAAETDAGRTALAGLLTVLLLFAGAVAVLATMPPVVRVAMAAAIVLVAATLKVFGMAALFLMIGQRILSKREPRHRPAALAAGLALLGAISIVPALGPLVWSAASVYGVGVASLTRLGAPRFHVAIA